MSRINTGERRFSTYSISITDSEANFIFSASMRGKFPYKITRDKETGVLNVSSADRKKLVQHLSAVLDRSTWDIDNKLKLTVR